MKPEIGLADLVRAMTELRAHGDDPAAIGRVLGFAPSAPAPDASAPPAPVPPPITGSLQGTLGGTTVSATGTASGTSSAQAVSTPARPRAHGPVALRALGHPETAQPAWLPQAGTGADLLTASPPPAPPPLETLFEPRRHRALLSAALTTFDDHGPLDIERLTEELAARRLPRSLPRRPEASLRRGAWLLLDQSAAMEPFLDDITDLVDRIARVVGRDLARVVQRFTETPELVRDDTTFDERPITLPPPGTPLVAITDFGIRSGTTSSWRPLLQRLATRQCRAIAVVPYQSPRTPPELRGLVALVPWDRATRVRAVKHRRRSPR